MRLEEACLRLFQDSWPVFLAGGLARKSQAKDAGTVHRTRDVEGIDQIDLDRQYRAGDLINILRARTFPPYAGAYFLHNGAKIFMRLQLLSEEQL
jgi:methionyl-tRNA formyltransferase